MLGLSSDDSEGEMEKAGFTPGQKVTGFVLGCRVWGSWLAGVGAD